MASIGLPVPPGFTITTEMCARYYAQGRELSPTACAPRSPTASPISSRSTGKQVRRRRRSAARLGPLGRARVDAGDDGHRPQPRPQRRDGAGPRRRLGRRALRLGQLSPLHPDVLRRRARPRPRRCSRKRSRSPRKTSGVHLDTELTADDWQALVGALQGAGRASNGASRSRRTCTSSCGARSARCSARWQSDRAKVYRRLNDIPGDWGTAVNVQAMVFGNMGETSRHRRRLHPRSLDRRARLLRRVSDQRAGRGRRRRHPHAAISDQRRARGGGGKAPSMEEAMPEALRRARPRLRPARAPLPRHAGHRVHRRARQALDAADPHRQAHRQGGAARSRSTWRAKG